MENETPITAETKALQQADVSGSATLKDTIAIEIMKSFIETQGRRRRITFLNRIKYWLGRNDWKADYDYNMPQIAQKSYECAEMMMEARKQHCH